MLTFHALNEGLMHHSYVVQTDKNTFIIKQLNKTLAQYKDFAKSEAIATRFAEQGFPARVAIDYNDDYAIYDYIDGQTLNAKQINHNHICNIAKTSADMHTLTIKIDNAPAYIPFKTTADDWHQYINKSHFIDNNYINRFIAIQQHYDAAIKHLQAHEVISQRDFTLANILWHDDGLRGQAAERRDASATVRQDASAIECRDSLATKYQDGFTTSTNTRLSKNSNTRLSKNSNTRLSAACPRNPFTIIDWELAGHINPDLECLQNAIDVAVTENHIIDQNVFDYIGSYRRHRDLTTRNPHHLIDGCMGSWNHWILFCLKRQNRHGKALDSKKLIKEALNVLDFLENNREKLASALTN